MNGNRGKMRDATAEAQECEWRRLRLTWLSVVSAYLLFRRSRQQGGLSTPFGWRLTALKMTGIKIVRDPFG